MMGRFGIPEDQAIENRFITGSLENAQAKIEGHHFDSRKHTLEYDDVMNQQRNVIYSRRRLMLMGEHSEIENFLKELYELYPELEGTVLEKRTAFGDGPFFETVRRIALHVTDALWVEHLETMEYTRSSVNLRAYGQREPLIEYKKEGLKLFKEMDGMFKEQVVSFVKTMQLDGAQTAEIVESTPELILNTGEGAGPIKSNETKVGRNEPCPCGSGKKYKQCHGK